MYCPLFRFRFCFFFLCQLTSKNKHKKVVSKNQCNLGTQMIKIQNAGLRAPRKISLGSGLQSQKRIRAPVSKMIGLRAPKQKFQGSRAPGLQGPPLWDPEGLIWVKDTILKIAVGPSVRVYVLATMPCKGDSRVVISYVWKPMSHSLRQQMSLSFFALYLTIISRARVGYEMVDSQRGV